MEEVLDDSWLAGECDAEFEAEPGAEVEDFWEEGVFPMASGSKQNVWIRRVLNASRKFIWWQMAVR